MDDFHSNWAQACLNELLAHESFASSSPLCTNCSCLLAMPGTAYQCSECSFSRLLCKACVLKEHKHNRLHLIQQWNSAFFKKKALHELRLVVHLGHEGASCPLSTHVSTFHRDVLLIDVSGYQTVKFQFCGCLDGLGKRFMPLALQLVQFGVFPVSFDNPRSGVTFRALRSFQMLTQQCKTNAYDFNTYL